MEIIESSGRPRSAVNSAADDKATATAREGVVIGGGFAGGAARGTLAGLACGPDVQYALLLGYLLREL